MSDRAELRPARVFLALWPDDRVRERLAEAGKRLHKVLGGRLTRSETIHLTLAFIGDLGRERIPELIERLNRLDAAASRVEFDQAACWRHNRIAYLAPSQPPRELFDLVARLESVLDELAIPFDRRPFKPHITLLRKAECPKANPAGGRVSDSPEWGDIEPILWSAERFMLVESVPIPVGMRYDKLGSFGLL